MSQNSNFIPNIYMQDRFNTMNFDSRMSFGWKYFVSRGEVSL